ncbi:predicted protein [Sclerotinia sclerotiorum 1980 UF-70]|uniref:Uncharacterized protein n=1 Tax=Sclerotinia sclerotiorum (strain ATCC 18683 / 1980 / Ss-1) TaxID=665079 RepID=A7EC95_SCLS1|nr:predicted protein [Sclerotinia sclerotiorum 1980 UF-70]EDO00074.1 predicted protein [Sclerotinia sclerotiorum 1980 UF-70]
MSTHTDSATGFDAGNPVKRSYRQIKTTAWIVACLKMRTYNRRCINLDYD